MTARGREGGSPDSEKAAAGAPDGSADLRSQVATLAEKVADEMAAVDEVDWPQVRGWVKEMARLTSDAPA